MANAARLEKLYTHALKLLVSRPRSVYELRSSLERLCNRWTDRAAKRAAQRAKAREDQFNPEPFMTDEMAPIKPSDASLVEEATCEELVGAVITRLEAGGELHDERFAEWWADQRVTFKAKPRAVIAAEMRFRHKIDDETSTNALDVAGADDLEACRREATRLGKRRSGKKLTESLLRKGFSYKLVQQVVDNPWDTSEVKASAWNRS
jgi:SOS response regulatory protein OraA/RecX